MSRLSGIGIRTKLFSLFLALILAPFLVYTAITLRQGTRTAERTARYTARQALQQAAQFIESRIEVVNRSLTFIRLDPTVSALCAADPVAYRRDLSRWNVDAGTLRRIVLNMGQSNPDLAGFALYMERGLAVESANDEFQLLAAQRGEEWYHRAVAAGSNLLWFSAGAFPDGGGPRRLHAVARVPDDLDLAKTVGYLRVDVPERILELILDQAQFSASSALFLLDADGGPIALSARARGADRPLLPQADAAFPAAGDGAGYPRQATMGGRRYLADGLRVAGTDWRLILLVPWEDIDAFGKGVRRQMLFALAVILPLLLPLSYLVASTSTRRIARLAAGVREFERGNLAARVPVEGGDEIGELTGDLNRMAGRIESLLDEQYRLGQEMKHSEMRALQAQINPHFLYNTLELVNCLALRHGAPAIGGAVEALSRFYRLSLSGGAETVTLAQELEHVEIYVRIQNMRFDDGIAFSVQVPGELRRLPILKIVLQPLVENAILHGIRERESGRGTIAIRAFREAAGPGREDGAGALCVEVADDGVGMDPGRLAELRQGVRASEGHGYGVRNIDRRLKIRYGPSYGLAYRSERGRGTWVTVRIPAAEPDGSPEAGPEPGTFTG
ncbi:MAG TPA: sensor histidine kinase [Anaeromyxobacter sp.]|nr:sensor histidine kinase [Anaeromyxobacter sp.]